MTIPGSLRPHVLFVGQSLPYPVDSGAHIRSYHTLRLLASGFDVSCLFFNRRSVRPPELARSGVEGIAAVPGVVASEVVPVPGEERRARFIGDHLCSVATRRAYTRYTYRSAAARDAIARLGAGRPFDLVHLDSLDLTDYLPGFLGRVPVVVSHHNLESRLLRRRADLSQSSFRRAYLRLQAELTRREEARWVPRIDLNLVVSELDLEAFREVAPGGRYAVLPNCVDTGAFRPEESSSPEGIVFLGGYAWEPNRDAMEFFCREVLPGIRAAVPGCRVTWLAKEDEETCAGLSRELGIDVVGYVPEIRPYIAGAACYVVPLRVGGGTRLKIVEAWAMGCAVVSTSIGAEGLLVEDGTNSLIADTAGAFADAVLRVLRDEGLRRRLGAAARRTAETHYDWDGQRDELLSRYRSLVPPRLG